jgi:hypothetical protein
MKSSLTPVAFLLLGLLWGGSAFAATRVKLRVVGCPVQEYQCSGAELNGNTSATFFLAFPDGDPPREQLKDFFLNGTKMDDVDLTQKVVHCGSSEGQRKWSLKKNVFKLHYSCENESLDIEAICKRFDRICTVVEPVK